MSPSPTPTAAAADALASLRDIHNPKAADRPSRIRLDSGINIELPSPRVLARTWALPTLAAASEVFNHGATLARRPHGTTAEPQPADPQTVADELRERIEALSDRADTGRPYHDLRIYLRDGDRAGVAGYLRATVRAVRVAAPKWRRPDAERQPRSTRPMTAAERQQASRARRRACEIWCAEDWLRSWLKDTAPGTRVDARELYDQAADVIGEDVELFEEDPDSWTDVTDDDAAPAPAVPGVKTFYAAADRVIGPRSRVASGYCYTAPMLVAADVVDRVARLAWDENRDQTLTAIAGPRTAEEGIAA